MSSLVSKGKCRHQLVKDKCRHQPVKSKMSSLLFTYGLISGGIFLCLQKVRTAPRTRMNVATAVSEMSGNRRLEPPSVCSWDITSPEKKTKTTLEEDVGGSGGGGSGNGSGQRDGSYNQAYSFATGHQNKETIKKFAFSKCNLCGKRWQGWNAR